MDFGTAAGQEPRHPVQFPETTCEGNAMTRLGLSLCCIVLLASSLDAAPARKLNVVFFFSDDQRHDTIAALGNEDIRTPNLDRLVRGGFAFTHAFCMGSTMPAVCAPSRAMLLTGRTLYRAPVDIPSQLPTWPEIFRKAGYTTFGAGKWHNERASYTRSFTTGGPVFFGGMDDHFHLPVYDFDPTGKYADKPVPAKQFSSELFADAAIRFLRSYKEDKPFFVYLAFTAPHDPRTPPGEYARMYDPAKLPLPASFLPRHPFDNGEMANRDEKLADWPRTPLAIRTHTADYYGMISHLDSQVGRILDTLAETKRDADTLVIFTSDHGLAVGRHGLMGKQNLYDHSTRPPLLLRGPGVPAGKRSAALCYLLDLFPTACELAGVNAPETVEGVSLVPVINGKKALVRSSLFGAYRDVQRMVRTDKWKLIRYPKIDRTQLFDVEHDPDELKDLAGERARAAKVKEMMDLLKEWQEKVGDK
jgi:arylsulfatase A-like enzyme